MDEVRELRHAVTLLLESARCLQGIKPDAGTEARIWAGEMALVRSDVKSFNNVVVRGQIHASPEQLNDISVLVREVTKRVISDIKNNITNGF